MDKNRMNQVYQSQRQHFKNQRTPHISERLVLLQKLKKSIKNNEAAIIKAIYNDFKKPEFESLTTELLVVYKELNLFIKNLKKWQKPKKVSSDLINFPSSDYIYNVPWGHVLVISPWNYPFQLAITPIIGAIATGNTVVLKPSEYAPQTAQILEHILSEIFKAEHCQVIQGDAETADHLLDLKWDFVFFTGSVSVGKIISQKIAKHLTPHCLELGGKNPCIIDSTADLKLTAKRIAWGKFINAGQTCIAPDYLLVHHSVCKELAQHIKSSIQKFYGDQISLFDDYARIISPKHYKRLKKLMENHSLYSGGDFDDKELYIAPTLILNPDLKSDLMQEEIFGPLLPIISYETNDEIAEIVNSFDKPLALYVFSKDRGFQKEMTQNFDFGGGVINDTIVHFVNDKLPFGGVGNSGIGNYHGQFSFATFTRQKAIVHRKTYFDIPLKYPPYQSTGLFKKLLKFFR
ncbi:MAG: aldehyde dehydrogenase [Flavobacteriaceae bacterium]